MIRTNSVRRGAARAALLPLLSALGAGSCIFSVAVAAPAPAAKTASTAPVADSAVVSGLGARNIGSATMSGRIAALDARVEEDGKVTVFVGAASGGVWKSTDGGTTFKPVFDKQPVQSIGAITLDPTNPRVVWVGTGETWTRNSVSIGNGVYRSDDGGETWTHMGLPESERVNRILVHPKNGDVVYVCVPGKLWSDSADRGLYKTTDGGKTWSLILKGPNLSTGCSGLTMDPSNPDRLYAGLWDFRRKGWTFRSGGEGPAAGSGSGLFLTENGGTSWTRLDATNSKGLPPPPWGRLDVEFAPSNPKIVYTVIEGTRSALFRSDDGGKTWEERDRSQGMVWRPFYFSNLVIDPTNADRVFKSGFFLIVSDDGGKSFSPISAATHADHHDVWINPKNPKHLLAGDDGGLWLSYDGGNKWWKSDNLPISQFYHVSVDGRDPYQVYGGLQDNSSWVGDSAYPGGITNSRWENLYGGDGFWVHSDPADENYTYAEFQGGFISRINRRTLESRLIQPLANYKEKLRWNWNTPIHVSPNDKGTIYIGSQFLFRSRNQGQSWDRISPDLTTNDKSKQRQEESGGITVDNSAAEMHTTIYSISESPKDANTIWVGTDDGNIQLTRDGGKTWTNVVGNVKGVPKASWVSWVEASRFDPATAYVAFDRHTYGDMTPHVFRTRDYGKTWTRIVGAESKVEGYAHVIREDVLDPDLLFVGTELGLWISIDGGANWAEYKGSNFPRVAVRDLVVHPRDHDLVLGTHGRGIWIVDDVTPLRALSAETMGKEVAFLESRPIQQRIIANGGWSEGDAKFSGQNPPAGAVISYYQKTRHVFGRLKVEVLDSNGNVVDTLAAGKRKGVNRVVWPMRVKPPEVPTAAQPAFFSSSGPRVLPGRYTVRITKAGQVYEMPIDVGLDRRAKFTAEDRKAQYEATMEAHGLFGRMSALTNRLNGYRQMVAQRTAAATLDEATKKKLASFGDRADEIRKEIVATKEGGAITGEERLREQLDFAYGALVGWEGRPGDYQIARVKALEKEFAEVEAKAAKLETELPQLNARLERLGVPGLGTEEAAAAGEQFAVAKEYVEWLERKESGVPARVERD